MSRHAKEVPLTHMIRCISRATPASEGLSPGRLRRARSRPSERPRHQLGGDLRLSFRYAGVQFVPLAMVSGVTNNDFFSGTKICSQRTPPSDRRSRSSRDEGKSSQAAMNTMLATDLVRQDRHESRLPCGSRREATEHARDFDRPGPVDVEDGLRRHALADPWCGRLPRCTVQSGQRLRNSPRDVHQLHTSTTPAIRAIHQPHAARGSSPRPSRTTAIAAPAMPIAA
jgi:hypothetical protein